MPAPFLTDLRQARRSLLRTPGATISAIVCLACAIGAATAMFTVVNAAVLRGLPFQHAQRLVAIWGVDPERDAVQRGFSWPDVQDIGRSAASLDAVAAMANAPGGMTLTGDGEPLQIPSRIVSGNFFDTLGVQAALGRVLSTDDDIPGSPNAAVISDGLWRQRYGGDPRVVGRAITLDGRPFTIAGVAPRSFAYPPRTQLWVTIAHGEPSYTANRSVGWLEIIGRMKPGVVPGAVRGDLAPVLDHIARTYHPSRGKETIAVTPLQDELLGRTRAAIWALFAGVIVLLGVACANVGGLLLVRGSARSRDVTVRVALGAGRADIIRYVLGEALLLAGCSAAIGAALAAGLVSLASRYLPAEAQSNDVAVDGAVLLFAI